MNRSKVLALPSIVIDDQGWADKAVRMPSPNFDQRADGVPIDLLVVHNISLPPGEFGGPYISDLFLNRLDYEAHPYFDQLRPLKVSAHFLIRRDGEIIQFVSARDRAWHAGVSVFCGKERCNDFSIGIEMEGTDDQPFEPRQYEALVALTLALRGAYPLRNVTGHAYIAPGRKTDPGPFFDWQRYQLEYRLAAGNRQEGGIMSDDLQFCGM
ncbi:MAG: 1,6-anhydro-N-acetylmuramyl-L-alanine amidase AmpD [Oxalicibacterium faecigallinarum]|uniref:1,6-anhydro-N-acetylmuramyl-L-alanine amidase AmpD n=1 Tax=Oxalicibacterium faecigallinarum TaxID=573741 RepID=UPI002807A0AC|nr:1,6-anhydro-N-acetylmuramyl-L-alanine amidase AmpD [Oxalicibacterium faecigallinarum]MDQ7970557.1 1,6-anhydro-N-acetylmuramyl-L-alanine amidase AmpD [Oxalicibacterium faecigallinarum]